MLRAKVSAITTQNSSSKPTTKQAHRLLFLKRNRRQGPVEICCIGLIVILVIVTYSVKTFDGLPWGGRGKSCTLKEFRDTGAWYGKPIDLASKHGLMARSQCPKVFNKVNNNQEETKVSVAFLIWTYSDVDVRSEYATTRSKPTPQITDECRSWCNLYEASNSNEQEIKDADLVMFSATDHGRAFGVTWCKHEYPKPFTDFIRSKNRQIRATDVRKQLWGAWTYEQARQFPQISDPVVTKNVDMMMNYRSDADVPITWFCPEEGPPKMNDYFAPPPPIKSKQ